MKKRLLSLLLVLAMVFSLMPAALAAVSTCRNSRLVRFISALTDVCRTKKPGHAGLQEAYWLTGDFGSSSSATRCRTCSSFRMPMCPARGMLEQAL